MSSRPPPAPVPGAGPDQTTPRPAGAPPPAPRRRRWLPILLLLLLGLGAAAAAGTAWMANAGWSTDPPQVLGIFPPPGSRDVAGDAPISIAFNMPMNPDSVRSALRIDPPAPGTFTWEGTTLIFRPQPGYQRGVTYTVEIGTGASSPLLRNLAAPARTSFQTTGLPALYRSVPPAGAANVPTDTLVTLQFSRPMAALAALDSAPDPSAHVHIQPDPGGHWQWLGSTTLAYRAATLQPATEYQVAVAQGLADYTGGSLDRDYQFSFTTLRPAIAATQPETDTQFAGRRDPIVVTFNEPVDHASAQAGFSLAPAAPGTFTWAPDSRVFTYTLRAPLPADTPIQATLAGVKPATGSLALAAPYTWGFRTSPRPRIADTTPADGATDVALGNELIVHYSAPVSNTDAELKAGLRVDPPVQGLNAYSYDQGATLNIFAPLAPSTDYTVTVGAGAGYQDRDGQPVPAYTWHFRTARRTPDAHALSNDGMVNYYAGLPTRVFVSAVNVDGFLRMRLWKLSGAELASYMTLTPERRAEYQPRTAVARTWDIPATYQLDQIATMNPVVSLDGQGDRLPPGFYYLRVSTPQTANSPGTINGTALVVGNAGLIMKQGPGEAWIWAVDMGSAKPLAGRQVRVLAGGQPVGTAVTDADGLGHILADWNKFNSQPVAILDDAGDAAVVASWWNENIGPWNFNLNFKDRKYNSGQAIYTDRAIYRPGQMVYFKGILRDDDDGHYSVPTHPVDVTVNDNQGRPVYSATLALSPYGSFAGQYALPDYAPLGTYYLTYKCPNDTGNCADGAAFDVQEYRKPEYLVDVITDKKSYVNGESIAATAGASYFFGGPVAGASLTVRVLTQDYLFTWTDPVTGAWYDFQDPEPLADRRNSFQGAKRNETTATSNAAGQVTLQLPADVSTDPLSQVETIEATVQDSANQAVSSNTQVIVHKAQYYAGLHPTSYLGTAGQPLSVEVQTLAAGGDRFPHAALALTFYRREWEQTTEKDETGLDRPTWKPRDTLLTSSAVTTDAQGHAQASFTPAAAGEYRIAVEGRDAAGNVVSSATYAYITAATSPGPVAWRQTNDSIVSLVADKTSYQPGDVAHILVTSPFAQATGLLTVERGHILSHRLVDLRGPSPVIDLPIDDGYLPNVYLSLSMVAPPGSLNAMPGFRQGFLALPVSAAQKQLTVTITPSSSAVHPRDSVTYTITTRDAAGAPVAAELSLALVDKAIFSLAGDTTPTLMDSFYGVRGLDLNTASSLLFLADQVATARASGGKGGGGGAGGADFVRSQFSDTAYWRAQVTTDARGQAVVVVTLPDNLTTWRLTALAVTADTRVGQATNEVVSSRPVLLRPRVPRFLVGGDRVEPAVIIENHSSCQADVDVTLVLAGATFVAGGPAATQRVHLDGEKVVSWQITAGQEATTRLDFTVGAATCGSTTVSGDSVEVLLPVKPPLAPEVVTTSGDVGPDSTVTEHVFLPHGVDPGQGALQLAVTPSLAAGAAEAVQYVQDEQYDNIEQTVSRFLPLLQLSQAYATAGLTTTYSAAVPPLVNRSVARLYRDQHYDGGWGWFDSVPSDPYLTAYALEGLTTARAAGYPVSQPVVDNAATYLQKWLSSGPADARGAPPRFNTRAYVLFVLAENGKADLALARALAVRTPSLALYGRAYLALAFQRLGAAADARTLLTDLAGAARQTTTTAHWEEPNGRTPEAYVDMDSDARTTALVVQGLLAQEKTDPLVAKAVRWLMENRRAGHWLSTQETATILAALAAYMTASGELNGQSTWTATVNNAPWGASPGPSAPGGPVELQHSIKDLLINQDNTVTLTRQGSGGRLYYTLSLSYARPGAAVTARNEGLSILREYVPAGQAADQATAPLQQVAAGALVEVRLTVIAPSDAYYLVADDPLPAGLEAVDGTLQTTGLTERLNPQPPYGGDAGQGDSGPGKDAQAATATFFDNVEMHDDRTVLYAAYLPAGVYEYRYLARATTPGDYTVLPASVHLAYLPDVWGRSDSGHLTVK